MTDRHRNEPQHDKPTGKEEKGLPPAAAEDVSNGQNPWIATAVDHGRNQYWRGYRDAVDDAERAMIDGSARIEPAAWIERVRRKFSRGADNG